MQASQFGRGLLQVVGCAGFAFEIGLSKFETEF